MNNSKTNRFQKLCAFTLAEVLIAKRERGKMSLLNISRARELKEPSNRFQKLCAFTLAEVLITLGIIGVVAALTIPTLMNNVADSQYKTAYKKAYSEASQAWMGGYTKGNVQFCSNWSDSMGGTCHADNFKAFMSEIKVTKDCGTDTFSCWNSTGEQAWGSRPVNGSLAFVDASGFAWSKVDPAPSGEVVVDTNGNQKPNAFGKDRFIFVLCSISANEVDSAQTTFSPCQANVARVNLYRDFPNALTTAAEQTYRCPSMATHPCYYTSWITGEH